MVKIGDKKERTKFSTFEDLEIYKKAREFRKKIYEMIRKLPPKAKYNLDLQMRRAVVSRENIQFCRHSRGSLEEIIDDLNVCLDERYFPEDFISGLKTDGYELLKAVNGYIKYLKKMKKESK